MSRFVRPVLMMLALFAAPAVQAQSSNDPQAAQDKPTNRGRDQALPASVRRVERETGGEVISAEPVQRDGREVYHLKVLTADGRVRTVQEDPSRRRDQASRQNQDRQAQDRQDRDRQNQSRDQDPDRQDRNRQDQARQDQLRQRQDQNRQDRNQRNTREPEPRRDDPDKDDNNDSQA